MMNNRCACAVRADGIKCTSCVCVSRLVVSGGPTVLLHLLYLLYDDYLLSLRLV